VLDLRANGGQDTPVLGGEAEGGGRSQSPEEHRCGLGDGNRMLPAPVSNGLDHQGSRTRTEWAVMRDVDFSLIYTFIIDNSTAGARPWAHFCGGERWWWKSGAMCAPEMTTWDVVFSMGGGLMRVNMVRLGLRLSG
jgi:hypothetical protein